MAVSISERQQLVPLAALLVLAIVSVLTLMGLWWWQPAIETDLLQRTRQALVAAGLPADGVHFSGRDGILTGTISSASDAARLQAIVSGVYGVRTVENHLIPAATAHLLTPPSDALL
ncbi:MAG: BON domain-containing protein, partial [Thiothrix sp.]